MKQHFRVAAFVLLASLFAISCKKKSTAQSGGIRATLKKASTIRFPNETDSNSPSYWIGDSFYQFNSSGHPVLSHGRSLESLTTIGPVQFDNTVPGRRWMEAVIPDRRGLLYGFYHYEPAMVCPGVQKTAPEIGLARSEDGLNWTDLGIVIRSGNLPDCDSPNKYFVGGVGDESVLLDAGEDYLYIYYSTYDGPVEEQGVAVGRMLWDDRDEPKVNLYYRGAWDQPGDRGETTPIWTPTRSWNSATPNAFWGPSIHWNAYLERYVMLVNRVKNADFNSDGMYVSFSTELDLTSGWSAPAKILDTHSWYPQVVGLEPGMGTDKLAGKTARFFLHGTSEYEIVFEK